MFPSARRNTLLNRFLGDLWDIYRYKMSNVFGIAVHRPLFYSEETHYIMIVMLTNFLS